MHLLLALGGEPVTDEAPRILRVCSRDDPVGGCDERLAAMAAGTFYADYAAWGWVSTETPTRYMSDNAFTEVYIHRREYQHANYTGPYCQMELPSLGLLRKYAEKQALGR